VYLLKINEKGADERIDLPWEFREGEDYVKFLVSDTSLMCTMLGNIIVGLNGTKYDCKSGPKTLKHNNVIFIKFAEYRFQSPEYKAARRNYRDCRRATRSQLIAKKNTQMRQQRYKANFCKFVNRFRLRNYRDLVILLTHYLRKAFAIERLIWYVREDEKHWKAVFAKAEEGFTPPHAVLDKVFLSGSPHFIQTTQLDENSRSASLRKYEIKTSFCVPFSDDPFLAIYGDSTQEEMSKDAYLICEYLINYAGAHLKDFFRKQEVPPLNVMEL